MNRENNKYTSEAGEVLSATEMLTFVKSEAKKRYENCYGKAFVDLEIDEQQEHIIKQFQHQLDNNGWAVNKRVLN